LATAPQNTHLLLTEFEKLFQGVQYKHRVSNQGDKVAGFLYEDLFNLAASQKFNSRVSTAGHVINKKNQAIGQATRRGDGTFGERVPASPPIQVAGLNVALGDVATIEIGSEVKILAKAMIKQIDRVCTDLRNQAEQFRQHHPNCICVALVGINQANSYTGYEGSKEWPTDGRKYKHPIQEADEAERHLNTDVRLAFDEMVVLRFKATNVAPYPFVWVNPKQTQLDYSASLLRIARLYDKRF